VLVCLSRFYDNLGVGEYVERREDTGKKRPAVVAPFKFELDRGDEWAAFFIELFGPSRGIHVYENFKKRQTEGSQEDISEGRCFVENNKFYCEFLKRDFVYAFGVPGEGMYRMHLQNLVLIADDANGLDISDARDVKVEGRDLFVLG